MILESEKSFNIFSASKLFLKQEEIYKKINFYFKRQKKLNLFLKRILKVGKNILLIYTHHII